MPNPSSTEAIQDGHDVYCQFVENSMNSTEDNQLNSDQINEWFAKLSNEDLTKLYWYARALDHFIVKGILHQVQYEKQQRIEGN